MIVWRIGNKKKQINKCCLNTWLDFYFCVTIVARKKITRIRRSLPHAAIIFPDSIWTLLIGHWNSDEFNLVDFMPLDEEAQFARFIWDAYNIANCVAALEAIWPAKAYHNFAFGQWYVQRLHTPLDWWFDLSTMNIMKLLKVDSVYHIANRLPSEMVVPAFSLAVLAAETATTAMASIHQ